MKIKANKYKWNLSYHHWNLLTVAKLNTKEDILYVWISEKLLKWHFPPKASESPLITTKAQPTAWRSQEALTSFNHKQAECWNILCTCSVEVWQQRFQHIADITGMKVEDILFFFSSFLDQFNLQVLVEMIFLWFLVFIFVIFWFLFCWIFGFLFWFVFFSFCDCCWWFF